MTEKYQYSLLFSSSVLKQTTNLSIEMRINKVDWYVMALWTSLRTNLVHGCWSGQKVLLQQLLPRFLVLHLDLRHHVAWHKTKVTTTLSSVKAIWIFISMNLVKDIIMENQMYRDEIFKDYAQSFYQGYFNEYKHNFNLIYIFQGPTLMICPSENGNSSSAASGLGDMVAGS